MNAREIFSYYERGKYLVWVDDKIDKKMTPEYLETHTLFIAPSLDYAFDTCRKLQSKEREKTGRAITRYRISSSELAEDHVCTEDLTRDQMEATIDTWPVTPEEQAAAKRYLIEQQKKLRGNS